MSTEYVKAEQLARQWFGERGLTPGLSKRCGHMDESDIQSLASLIVPNVAVHVHTLAADLHDVTFGKGGPGGRCSDCHEDLTEEQGKAVVEASER